MRVLWIVNPIPIDLCRKLNISSENLGGWVESMAGQLSCSGDTELAIACKCDKKLSIREDMNGIAYYGVAYDSSSSAEEIQKICEDIIADFKPQLIHIEGTEFPHAGAMQAAGKKAGLPVLVSLQGILSGYYAYQCGELQMDDLLFSGSLTKIYAGWLLHFRKTRWFKKRVDAENRVIEQAEYITGRTSWDKAHAYKVNPNARYYHCSRILRPSFYKAGWDINGMERHSVYVGNTYSALKGFHFVVMALPELIREYPDVKVYAAGVEPFIEGDKRPFYKKGYGAYLQKLIKELGVGEHIVFTGSLSADQVAQRLAKSNAYVLCSTIENSPNTLGEAMMIGTPCVAAYVGGVSDMAADGKEALFYRSNDPALLAWNIKQIFDDDNKALSLSENAKKRAAVTHDAKANAEQLIANYKDILRIAKG